MTADRCPTCDRDYCNRWLWSRRADRNPAFPTQAHQDECDLAGLRARAIAAESDAAKWRKVEPLIERLREAREGCTSDGEYEAVTFLIAADVTP